VILVRVTEGVRRIEYDACEGVEGVDTVENEEGGHLHRTEEAKEMCRLCRGRGWWKSTQGRSDCRREWMYCKSNAYTLQPSPMLLDFPDV
jgi:hypothetical protein